MRSTRAAALRVLETWAVQEAQVARAVQEALVVVAVPADTTCRQLPATNLVLAIRHS